MRILDNFITLCKYFVDTFIRTRNNEYEDIDECADLEQGGNQELDQDVDKENNTNNPNIFCNSCSLRSFLCYSFRNIIYFGMKRLKYK